MVGGLRRGGRVGSGRPVAQPTFPLHHHHPTQNRPTPQPPSTASDKDLAADELATVRLFQKATPSVVNIANIANFRVGYGLDTQAVPQGTGSGFVWDSKVQG